MQVANTILQQLGGGRFIAMTGSKNFVGRENGLSFSVGRNDAGVNKVRVILTPADVYTVEAFRVRGTTVKLIGSREGVYCDNLRAVFETLTGLRTSL
jgi:hypothetical protein